MKKNNQLKPASPHDFLTYMFDLPVLKEEFRENAVRFALKQVYPGDVNNTLIDIYATGKKTICVVIPKDKYLTLNVKTKYYSPVFLFLMEKRDGVYIYLEDDFFIFVEVKNKSPVKIATYPTNSDSINSLHQSLEGRTGVKILFSPEVSASMLEKFRWSTTVLQSIEEAFSDRKIQNSILYTKTKNKHMNFSLVVFLCMCFFLLGLNSIYYRKNVKVSNELINQKKIYDEKMKQIRIQKEVSENKMDELKTFIPFDKLIQDISIAGKNIELNTLTVSNNSFRIDCQCESALLVMEYLENIEYLENVTLHQSSKIGENLERFVISGDINVKR